MHPSRCLFDVFVVRRRIPRPNAAAPQEGEGRTRRGAVNGRRGREGKKRSGQPSESPTQDAADDRAARPVDDSTCAFVFSNVVNSSCHIRVHHI